MGHRRRLIGKPLVAAAALAGLLGATPASSPSGLPQITVGKPATQLTFAPIGGSLRPMVVPGKPTIVIVFASWCSACVDEMPRNVKDYTRFKDRVNFLGIDYVDSATGGDAMIAKFAIPFPVERLGLDVSAIKPVPPGGSSVDSIQLHGVTPTTIALILPSIQSQMPALYPTLTDIAARCAQLSESQCLAYANSKGVSLDADGHLVAPPTAPAGATVSLPVAFVIAENGNVIKRIEGYDPGADSIAAALAAIGIR